jgi:hypothetical protein
MNAKKAWEKKKLKRGMKLAPGPFHPKYLDWRGKVLYVNATGFEYWLPARSIYATETDPFHHDIRDHDMILTAEKKKKYRDRIDYLGYFKILKD